MESFEKLLKFAVIREEEAAAFYEFLAAETESEHIRKVFSQLSEQEKGHRKTFEKIIKEGCRLGPPSDPRRTDLQLSNYLVETPFDPRMSYQDALILAMKREEKSEALYRDLSRKVADACLAETLVKLADEEASHKSSLENLYEREVLTED